MINIRRGGSCLRPKLISAAVASCFAASVALANPTSPVVVNGQVSFLQNGTLLQITNSPSSIINWRSFSIGANEITRFIQQSQASAVLNRVTGSAGAIDPSVILGALQSNGRVFLVNPGGILFGAGAQIDVAGLVATSLNLSNADFLAGRLNFTEAPGAGSVVNRGNITTGHGGEVYLVGPAVANHGIITSPNGDVVLAAGNSVELVSPGTPDLRVEVKAPDNEARNLGQIAVNSGRAGIYAGLINNSGTIRADSVVAEGGRILLKATKSTTLADTSVLSAQGKGGGEIKVLAGENVRVAGKLDASAPNGGDGGLIETSASRVQVAPDHTITTAAPLGKTGNWLIDPTDYYIGSGTCPGVGCDYSAAQLGADLATTSVTIQTGGSIYNPGPGDIYVNDAISWSSANFLELTAAQHVWVNSNITNSGTGPIRINAGWNGTGSVNSPARNTLTNPGDIVQASNVLVRTDGSIFYQAGRNIVLTNISDVLAGSGGTVVKDRTIDFYAGGDISLNNAVVLASAQTGIGNEGNATVSFTAGGKITVDFSDVAANADRGSPGGNGTVNLAAAGAGGITLQNGSNVVARGGYGVEGPAGGATVNLCAGSLSGNTCTPSSAGGIAVFNSQVFAEGGAAGSAGGGEARIQLVAGSGGIQVAGETLVGSQSSMGNIRAQGGYGGGFFSPGGNGTVTLDTTGGITVGDATHLAGRIEAYGGGNSGGRGGDALVQLGAGSAGISIGNGSGVSAGGGGASNYSGVGGNATVLLDSAGNIAIGGGSVVSAMGGAASYYSGVGGNATVQLNAAGGITLTDASVYAEGGSGYSPSGNGNAFVGLRSPGAIVITGSGGSDTIAATGRQALVKIAGADGGEAAGDPPSSAAGSISLASAGVRAAGAGDGAQVHLLASGAVDSTSSDITAEAINGGEAQVYLRSVGGAVSLAGGGTVNATDNSGGPAAMVLVMAGGGILVDATSINATNNASYGGTIVGLRAGGDIVMNGGYISAYTYGGGPSLVGLGAGNNLTLGGTVYSTGGSGSSGWFSGILPELVGLVPDTFTGIALSAGNQIISTGGWLNSSTNYALQAVNGIGTPAAPIQFRTLDFGAVMARNTGSSGDIALDFNLCCSPVVISDATNILNSNPAGTYFVQVDGGEGRSITLAGPFQPGGADPLPGQTVHLKAITTSTYMLDTAGITISGGSIAGAGQVTLEGRDYVQIQSGSSVGSAGNVLLKADDMDIQGTVTAANNIFVTPFNAGRTIDLGGAGSPGSALALDGFELSNLTALGLGIGTDGTTANTGAISITAPVGPFSAIPNLYGSTITQGASGTAINSPGGLNAFASGDIVLTDAGNSIGTFGGTSGGNLSVATTGNIGLGVVTATGTASVTSTGGDVVVGSGTSISSGAVSTLTGLNVTQSGGMIGGLINASATGGNVSLSQSGGYNNLGALSATGAVGVTSTAGDVVVGSGTSISSGTGSTLTGLNVTQSGGTISGPISASATAGNVGLTQAGGYTLGAVSGTGTVTVTSTGADVIVGTGASVSSGTGATLTGLNVTQSGGTISGPISASATAGNVSLTQAGDYNLRQLSATGSVSVNSAGNISAIDTATSYADIAGGSVELAAGGFIDLGHVAGHGNVTSTGGSLNIMAGTGFGGCTSPGDCYAGALTANGGNIAVSTGSFFSTPGPISAPSGSVSISSGTDLEFANVNAGSAITLTAVGGSIFNIGGASGLLTAPTINLAAANGIGSTLIAPIFVSGVTNLSASNSGAGDIVISEPAGNFTIGAGGWMLANAGGGYLIGGNTVTLASGGPSSGDLFVGANNIMVAPSGYSNSSIVGLTALNDINVNGNLSAGDLALVSGNAVNINSATASATGSVSVVASALNLAAGGTAAQLKAGTDLGIVAGDIALTGGSGTDAFAELRAGPGMLDVVTLAGTATSGNIVLKGGSGAGAYARILGEPDVGSLLLPVSVGGVIQMTSGTGGGAYARIESASASSIYVDFANLSSGGYFVNGVEGVVWSGDSGFYAGGVPAILGQNLTVTYGGLPLVELIPALPGGVQQAIDQVVTAINQQNTTLTEGVGSGGGGTGGGDALTPEEKRRRSLPICSR